MDKKKKILFVNFGGLGDEILFLPTIQAVKKQYPEAEVTLALEERSKGIIQLTNSIDKIYTVNIKNKENKFKNNKLNKILSVVKRINELLKLLFKIWGEDYNLVIASGGNILMSIFIFATLIPKKIGYNTGKLSTKLLTRAVELNKNQYAMYMYGDLAKPLTDIEIELPSFSIQKKPKIQNTVLIHPGVSKISVNNNMIKTISAHEWAKVVELLADSGRRVVLAGGPDDKECIETIQKIVPKEKFTNLYGKTKNLRELAELISSVEVFVCSDSAPLHIAVGMGTKTYVIFGSTDDKKLIPQNDWIIPIKNNYNCPLRPCLWERRQTTCEELYCLKISANDIVRKIIG